LTRLSYIPGWDCHGLPIENKTLEQLKVRSCCTTSTHLTSSQAKPHTIPADELRSAAKVTAENAIALQKGEMQQFGLLGHWATEGTYRTMGEPPDYSVPEPII